VIASFSQTWPAEVDSVALARRAVARFLDDASTPDPPLKDVSLVVSEAVTNVVQHAYGDGPCGEVRVSVELQSEDIEVVIEDDGLGMRPRPDSPGLGLGLPLIATVSERIDTKRLKNGGTRLCVWFRRDPGSAVL
jgi:serine/threonine-protein kinase RsbW